MIDFWIFPLSTIWGAYQIIGFTVRFLLPKRKNAVNLSFVKFH